MPDAADISALADHIAIQDVISHVTLCGDLRDFDGSFAMFTDDAVDDYASLLVMAEPLGLAEFRANAQAFRPALDTMHQISNFRIEVDGDEAVSLSTVRAVTCVDDLVAENGGIYTHRLRRTAAGWRICFVRYDCKFRTGPDVFAAAREKMAALNANSG